MATRLIFTLTAGFLLVGAQGGWQSAFSQANPRQPPQRWLSLKGKQRPRSSRMSIRKRATCFCACQMIPW